MANQIQPDADGNVTFRKSLFDDDGDAITVASVQVVKQNGLDQAPAQPAWLTYTVTDEQTAEGPKGSRLYNHVDITVDSDHAEIDQGSTYTIRITASDGQNPDKEFDFLYTNGYFDLGSVSGISLWISARKNVEGANPSDFSPNNWTFARPSTRSGTNYPAYNYDVMDNMPAFDFTERTYSGLEWTGQVLPGDGSTNPDGPAIQPFHIFIVAMNTSTGFYYLDVGGSERRFFLRKSNDDIDLDIYGPGYVRTIRKDAAFPDTSGELFHLLEIHRFSDGTLHIVFNNDTPTVDTAEEYFGTANKMGYPVEDAYLFEQIVYQHELTADQITNIRKTLKSLYPSLPFTL